MIDTHTHIYPDKIAPKVAETLKATAGKAFLFRETSP